MRFLFWRLQNGVLDLYKKDGGKADYTYTLRNDLLSMQDISLTNAPAITLQQESSNPLDRYKDYMPAGEIEGSWSWPITLENGQVYYNPNYFYDIHPATDNIGEIISAGASGSLDSLYFLKYNVALNAFAMANIHSAFTMLDGPAKDTNKHYYSFDWLNYDAHEDVDTYVSDGIIILNEFGHRVNYLTRSGPVHWSDVSALHNNYNTHHGRRILPPYGIHWVSCPICGGTGKVISGYDDVYSHTNSNGYPVYDKKERTTTCSTCDGTGGSYADDKTGKKITQ